MSKWQDFKKKHILLMHAAFTIAVPMAVWLVMEVLNSLICGVHTMNSMVDWTTLMRNLVSSFCFALGLNCNLPVGRMDTSTGSQMYLACIIGGNVALSLNLGDVQYVAGHGGRWFHRVPVYQPAYPAHGAGPGHQFGVRMHFL